MNDSGCPLAPNCRRCAPYRIAIVKQASRTRAEIPASTTRPVLSAPREMAKRVLALAMNVLIYPDLVRASTLSSMLSLGMRTLLNWMKPLSIPS